MSEKCYGDNDEIFRYSELYEALEMAWDAAPFGTENLTIWEGDWDGDYQSAITNVKQRTFRHVKNLDNQYFDFDDFEETGEPK